MKFWKFCKRIAVGEAKTWMPALTLLAGSMGLMAAPADAPTLTTRPAIWDGVFTTIQAKRGDALYTQHCAGCHMQDMGGREPAPAIAGDAFLSKWVGHSVGGLFRRISSTMPAGKPGSLSPQEYIDLIALLLQANDFPAGSNPLMTDIAVLDQITITEKRDP